MTEYDAVLFDSDGVLVEPPTYEPMADATRRTFRSMGVGDVAQPHIDAVVDDESLDADSLAELCAGYDIDPTEFWETRERYDEQSQIEAFRAGTRTRYDDVSSLADVRLPCGVVSNNHHAIIEFKLDFFEMAPLFETHFGRPRTVESLRLMKPNPHYIERAMADLDASSALYVGDKESDVLAAHRAGLDSALIRRDSLPAVECSVTPTHEIETLESISELVT
ncbi:HAD family hydrolase [Haloferax namakaokahaiae]|uniref:HAD family hydrolase n=1 Tax=Haloferax namakaokahaiae TaxID=1748331 RepID=A0ABD5ZAD9_9EURY